MHMRRVILWGGSSATDNALDDTHICINAAAVDVPNSKLTALMMNILYYYNNVRGFDNAHLNRQVYTVYRYLRESRNYVSLICRVYHNARETRRAYHNNNMRRD